MSAWCRIITYDGYSCAGPLLGTHHTDRPHKSALMPGTRENDGDEGRLVSSFFIQGDCSKILVIPTFYKGKQVESMQSHDGIYVADSTFLAGVTGWEDGVTEDPDRLIGIVGTGLGRLEEKCHDLFEIRMFDNVGAFVLDALEQGDTRFGQLATEDWFPDLRDCAGMTFGWHGKVEDWYRNKCNRQFRMGGTMNTQLNGIWHELDRLGENVNSRGRRRMECAAKGHFHESEDFTVASGETLATTYDSEKSLCLHTGFSSPGGVAHKCQLVVEGDVWVASAEGVECYFHCKRQREFGAECF